MIRPEDEIAPDDYNPDDADDQQSQQDLHSNGLDNEPEEQGNEQPNQDLLEQSFRAAESSYTLNLDEDEDQKKEEDDDSDEDGEEGDDNKQR